MIFIIDDDSEMANCIARACQCPTKIFSNAIEAMSEVTNGNLPNLILLDVLLDGPDGFTFLNELISYSDTEKIPVVVVSSLNLADRSLSPYGVVGVLDKDTMLPEEIKSYVSQYT